MDWMTVIQGLSKGKKIKASSWLETSMPDFCLQQIFVDKPGDSEHMGVLRKMAASGRPLPRQLLLRLGWGAHPGTSAQSDHRPTNPPQLHPHPLVPLPSLLRLWVCSAPGQALQEKPESVCHLPRGSVTAGLASDAQESLEQPEN